MPTLLRTNYGRGLADPGLYGGGTLSAASGIPENPIGVDNAIRVSYAGAGTNNVGVLTSRAPDINTQYTVSAYIYNEALAHNIALACRAVASGGSQNVTPTQWFRLSWTMTTNGSVGVGNEFGARIGTTTSAGSFLATGFLVEKSGTLGNFFDGDTTDTPFKIYEWLGTPQDSFSTESSVLSRPAMDYSTVDLEFEFYSRQSGLLSGTLNDHKYYFYKNALGASSGSLNEFERLYWASLSGLGSGFSLADHKRAVFETATVGEYNDNGKSYYAKFFS